MTELEGALVNAGAPALGPAILYTPEEAADLLNISRTALYGLVKSGELVGIRIGRSLRFTRRLLEVYAAKLERNADTMARAAAAEAERLEAEANAEPPEPTTNAGRQLARQGLAPRAKVPGLQSPAPAVVVDEAAAFTPTEGDPAGEPFDLLKVER